MDPSDDDYECRQIFQIMSWRFKREKYDRDDVFFRECSNHSTNAVSSVWKLYSSKCGWNFCAMQLKSSTCNLKTDLKCYVYKLSW